MFHSTSKFIIDLCLFFGLVVEKVFRHKLRFTASAKVASSFPPCEIPEVAFAGIDLKV